MKAQREPTTEEQRIAAGYVLYRPLPRPDTSIGKALICVVLFLALTALTGIGLWHLTEACSLWETLPGSISTFREAEPEKCRFWFFFLWFLLCTMLSARFAAVGAVRLYQRYASEEVRRRCLLMPTCSEYCILAIQKYGLIVGGIKTYVRLKTRCKGWLYRIDFP